MQLRDCLDKKVWDTYLEGRTHASFLQSWEWGEFQETMGNKPVRLQLIHGSGAIAAHIQGFEHRLGKGLAYLYLPRYECALNGGEQAFVAFFRQKKYLFIRAEPVTPISAALQQRNVHNRQPQHSMQLDLMGSEETLLAKMHTKTRYNIGLAEKKSVIVKTEKNAALFWRLNTETMSRDGFKSHGEAYYREMLKLPITFQYTAYVGETPVASNICIGFGDTYTYLHGASGNAFRNTMAPYLLQWTAMREAKRSGFRYYDFWGVAPEIATDKTLQHTTFHGYTWDVNHPFTGITRFKAGFGGTPVAYPQAVDIVFKPVWYYSYRLLRSLRQKFR